MNKKELNIIVPIRLEPNEDGVNFAIENTRMLYEYYGMKKFIYFCPSKGWRGKNFPGIEEFEKCARWFLEIKKAVAPLGISCGWWIATTVKAGYRDDFQMVIRENGTQHPFMICPLSENYRKAFCECMISFVKIAEPDFIFTEDDFQIDSGCFCDNHIKGFEKYSDTKLSAKSLVDVLKKREDPDVIKMWRDYSKSTLVGLAKTMRDALNKEYPHIPIGYMQTGATDFEGDSTDELVRVLAGDNNIAITRLFGCFYCGGDPAQMPRQLFHPLYSRQHLDDDIDFLHETDTYPHSKFFTSEKDVNAMFGMVFSWGFDGSIFHCTATAEISEKIEAPYAKVFFAEKERLTEIANLTRKCDVSGPEVFYDPFINTVYSDADAYYPHWIKAISQFGISYNTKKSSVAFIDERFARGADDKTITEYLSKGLFLDGDSAKILCDRGFGQYLGVSVGEDIFAVGNRMYDLGMSEYVCPEFGKGILPAANSWCPAGQGNLRALSITDNQCRIVTEVKDFEGTTISPAMTFFENSLGGKITVMGMTLSGNNSQSLFHPVRSELTKKLITLMSDEYVYTKNTSKIMVIANKPKQKCGFDGILTLINLGADTVYDTKIHIPQNFASIKNLLYLDSDGIWKDVGLSKDKEDVILKLPLEFQAPVYIMINRE